MIPETFRNPHSNLPFELFRSFGPMFDKHRPFTAWTPLCDIYETDKDIVLKMELPEMRKENVQVTFEKNVLTLRGERKFAEKVNRENYHRIERTYGEFVRTFALPTSVEGSTVLAEFKEGMLTVTLSKNEAAILRQIRSEGNVNPADSNPVVCCELAFDCATWLPFIITVLLPAPS